MKTATHLSPLARAFAAEKERIVTPQKLAEHFKLTRQAIDLWKTKGVPPEYVREVERIFADAARRAATEDRVTRHDLAPTLYPRE